MRGRVPLVIKRAFSEPLLLLAALGSILLATTTLVSLTMYASTIAEVGVRRTMETASFRTLSATVSTPVTGKTFAELDRIVRAQFAETYPGVPVAITTSMRSDSYVRPGQERLEHPELLRFGSHDDLQRQAKLIEGAWPGHGGRVIEAVLSTTAANTLGLKPGDEFDTAARLDGKRVRVKITGLFQLNDPFGDQWSGEPLLSRGAETGDFTTYGPLMVSGETFLARLASTVNSTWTALPDLTRISPDQLQPLAASVTTLREDLQQAGCRSCAAASRLPEMLTQLGTASLVARSTMLIPVLQLLLLSAYALMLTARLLADHRRMEVALLRSRGAGTFRLAGLAGGEALLVALPCALVAPFLASPLLSLVNSLPWIKSSGVRLALTPDLGTFLIALSVALLSAVLLALPALAGARRTYVEEQSSRGRGGARGLIQRAGADLALLVVAALAIWQLQHYGAPVTTTAAGGLGIDPLIISGPALALLTGGMLGLRLVPRVSKIAERITSKRPSLAPALGAWQVARRPLRYAGPALLLTMAIAIGIVSLATAATWRSSQVDQAVHLAGSDLRLSGPADGPELGAFGRGTAFAALPGVAELAPVLRQEVEFGATTSVLLATDSAKLGRLLHLRADLSDQNPAELGRALAVQTPAGLELPGTPAKLVFDLKVNTPDVGSSPVRAVLSDKYGVWRDVPLTGIRPGANRVEIDLRAMAGRSGELTYPLRLRSLVGTNTNGAMVPIKVERITADGRELSWKPQLELVDTSTPGQPPTVYLPDGPPQQAKPLPVVLTASLAAELKVRAGATTKVTFERRPIDVTVVGVVERMPTTTPERHALLVDWTALQYRGLVQGDLARPATEWWLAAPDTAPAAGALRTQPAWSVTTVDRQALIAQFRDDPLASGLQGALILGFAAALVFAALGFLVNASVAARERMSEFTILRALGVSFRQIFGLLAVEQAFVIGLSIIAGTALALVVGSLVVPHIVLTGQASAVTPAVLLDIPWPATAAMLVAVTVILFAIVALLARSMRKQGLGRVLRIGEDQ
ncbi:FtsX-like permease family protein [Nonomuraea sp. NPDC050328]|uniref:FtsX-like permease family protein n=1 Tax=Nonomuraea sp. NPDC050328 TaxID=3364361 RepID=UPI0037BE19D1